MKGTLGAREVQNSAKSEVIQKLAIAESAIGANRIITESYYDPAGYVGGCGHNNQYENHNRNRNYAGQNYGHGYGQNCYDKGHGQNYGHNYGQGYDQ